MENQPFHVQEVFGVDIPEAVLLMGKSCCWIIYHLGVSIEIQACQEKCLTSKLSCLHQFEHAKLVKTYILNYKVKYLNFTITHC